MYGYIAGYSITDYINFCPICGNEILMHTVDGSGFCEKCHIKIFVVIDDTAKVDLVKKEGGK